MADNNPFPGENNTGHIWDDNLRELDNPAPRWWMIAFWASILWVIGYAILYPMIPGLSGFTKGVMGWTQIGEYKEGLDEVEMVRGEFEAKLKGMTAKEILADEGLSSYTVASAKVLFGDNCAACHGAGGQGGPGYPVIADDDWLYGGSVEVLEQTIANGRMGVMPSHAKLLSDEEVDKLATAIMSGNPTAEPLFMSKACFACHGPDGKGMQALGSANLTDSVWRFAEEDQLASVKLTIKHGVNDTSDPMSRNAVMPKFGDRLSKDEIKKLAVYVYKLGGGQ
ncbi:cytochrome-c oxidase, cbb3-type subunit III [Sedimenticola selenatireducens]|uniref:Cbb3-type cytochrome c oxidase subunit n=1 Tax=Sedimenticola selenatireducens TaxID=191960 RepID=A0A557SK74_9GAMM|nr:cytochrome-c oxidase, cbb3-type subunit III [Sedimenticola selenatireducens]TVO77692.1 cytochrome-c oxidase, cbb3-type subunit III [Sedimenticola selenatireducens]TVT64998.1 MAG: cytochrome-c oxidase, cbb3-type subunit III [Sedimenticola selenatireducens]